jgi:hypothetical protein
LLKLHIIRPVSTSRLLLSQESLDIITPSGNRAATALLADGPLQSAHYPEASNGHLLCAGREDQPAIFQRGKTDKANTNAVWVYDMRADAPAFGKTRQLTEQ